jgi:hypothetical protein
MQVVCSIAGTTNTTTYSVTPVPGATSYQWGTLNGMTIVSGQGTNVLTVKFASTFISGNLSCMSVTPCGTSPMQYYTITKTPSSTKPITGLTSVCAYVGQTSTVTYSTTAISGVTLYNWSVSNPGTMSIMTGQGTTSITVKFLAGYTTGTISCIASTSCGNAPAASISPACTPVIASNQTGSGSSMRLSLIDKTDVACFGGNNGAVNLQAENATGAVQYYLNGELLPSSTVTSLVAGNYSAMAIDAANDTSFITFSIDQPEALSITEFVVKNPSASGLNDGLGVISASGGAGQYEYEWSGAVTSSLQVCDVLRDGVYRIKVTDANGCIESKSITIDSNIESISGSNQNSELNMNVYPVPANEELTIELSQKTEGQYLVRVFSMSGAMVFNEIIVVDEKVTFKLNSTYWEQGTYFIQVYDKIGGKLITKEVIIQH